MTWQEGLGLLRLLTEEQMGHPARAAERVHEANQIAAMQATLSVSE